MPNEPRPQGSACILKWDGCGGAFGTSDNMVTTTRGPVCFPCFAALMAPRFGEYYRMEVVRPVAK